MVNNGNSQGKSIRRIIVLLLKIILIALIINILIKSFLIRTYTVESSSMEKTLMIQDKIITDVASGFFIQPKRGDIIVFVYPKINQNTGKQQIRMNTFKYSKYILKSLLNFKMPVDLEIKYVKRVIGLPGDIVNIKNGKVYVNDEIINETYIQQQNITNITSSNIKFPYTVSSNHYFVLGDNRQNSNDSREWGTVPRKNIIGRAAVIFFPFSNFKIL